MTMNMDVTLRLVDKFSDPSRAATKALERFAAAATRYARSTGTTATATRGLAASIAGVGGTATSQATDRVSRLTRGFARLAGQATKATTAVRDFNRVMTAPAAGDTFVDRQNAALRTTIALQRQATAGAARMARGGGGGGGGRGGSVRYGHGRGHTPGLIGALQPDTHALRSVFEQATSLQDAIVKMHLNGLSDSEIASIRAKAEEVSKLNRSTTPLSNINAIMEARLALGGDLKEALETAPEMSKFRTVLGFMLGKDRAKAAEDATYDMLRTGELRGEISDTKRRTALFEGMTASIVASNGRITPQQFHKNVLYGRSAAQGWSDNFTNYRLPFLLQELGGGSGSKGGPAGVALQALFKAVVLGIGTQRNINAWRSIGRLDESKVQKTAMGERMLPGAVVGSSQAISDPDKFLYGVMDAMKAHGMNERGKQLEFFSQIAGAGTAQTAVDVMGLQRGRMDNLERVLKQVEDTDTLFAQINTTASQSVENLKAQLDTLSGNVGSSVIPTFTALTDTAARLVRVINGPASVIGGNGADPTNGHAAATSGALALGAAWGATALATRASRYLARGLVTALRFSRIGAFLPASALASLSARIMAALGSGLVLGLSAALKRGFLITAIAEVASRLGVDGNEKVMNDGNRGWGEKALTFLDPRIAEMFYGKKADAASPEIAGHRAAGGPVRGGSTYLVGERGPELFTPGLSGGITSNSALGRFGGGNLPEAARILGDLIARALRLASFDIVASLRELTYGARSTGYEGLVRNASFGGSVGDAGTTRGLALSGGRAGSISSYGAAVESRARSGASAGGLDARQPKAMITGGDRIAPAATLSGSSVDQSAQLLRRKEGFIGRAAWDVNHYRLGYGSDTITDKDGSVREVHQGDRVTREDAERDLRRRIPMFQARLAKQVGVQHWKALSIGAQAALTSVGYNYGSFAKLGGLRAAVATEDPAKIASAVAALQGHNGGVNRKRRLEEASIIARGGNTPADSGIPEVLRENAERARQEKERAKVEAKADRERRDSAPQQPHGPISIHVHPHPHHDEKMITAMVHKKFNDSVRQQLNDGAYA